MSLPPRATGRTVSTRSTPRAPAAPPPLPPRRWPWPLDLGIEEGAVVACSGRDRLGSTSPLDVAGSGDVCQGCDGHGDANSRRNDAGGRPWTRRCRQLTRRCQRRRMRTRRCRRGRPPAADAKMPEPAEDAETPASCCSPSASAAAGRFPLPPVQSVCPGGRGYTLTLRVCLCRCGVSFVQKSPK